MYACSCLLRKGKFSNELAADGDLEQRALVNALWEESTNQCGVRYASDSKNVSAGAHVGAMFARRLVHFVKRRRITISSLAFTSLSDQKKLCRSCTHSK